MYNLSTDKVKAMAEATLEEWFPGVTGFDDEINAQLRIVYLGDNCFRAETVGVFPEQLGEFHVTVSVSTDCAR